MTLIYSLMSFHLIEKLYGLITIEILFFNGTSRHTNFYNFLLNTTTILLIAMKYLYSHRLNWSVLQNGEGTTVTFWDTLTTNTLLLQTLSQFILINPMMFGHTNILSEEQTLNLNSFGGNAQWRKKLSSEHFNLLKNRVSMKNSIFSIRLKTILKQQMGLASFQ